MSRIVQFFVACAWFGATAPAYGHFLWLVVPNDAKNSLRAEMYFSECAEPGEAHLIDRAAPARFWRLAANGKQQDLKSDKDVRGDEAARVARLEGDRPVAVNARWQYGVRSKGQESYLLEYYARHVLDIEGAEKIGLGGDDLSLALRPTVNEREIVLVAMWKGRPAAGCEIIIYDPEGDEHVGKTDAEGRFRTKRKKDGLYSARVRLVEADRRGELDGKKYDGVRHYSTLTLWLSASPTEAAKLLAAARANRATWERFPGFRARITVHEDSQSQHGELSCSADGELKLDLPDAIGKKWAQSHVAQLVSHRMPAGNLSDAATFCDEPPGHPLGRLIRLEDAAMGSRYRICDNRITEVHRTDGARRFTISVLVFHTTAEGRYLPAVYSVVTWDNRSNQIESTRNVVHQWRRVGAFELPDKIVEIESRTEGRHVRSIEFSDHALLRSDR